MAISNPIELAAEIVTAFVSHNSVPRSELSALFETVHAAVRRLGDGTESALAAIETKATAVSIRKSVTPDYLTCLDDGKQLKSLRRHLSALWHDAGAVSRKMESANGLSDGGRQLRRAAVGDGEKDRARSKTEKGRRPDERRASERQQAQGRAAPQSGSGTERFLTPESSGRRPFTRQRTPKIAIATSFTSFARRLRMSRTITIGFWRRFACAPKTFSNCL